jgi:hypothetical protein
MLIGDVAGIIAAVVSSVGHLGHEVIEGAPGVVPLHQKDLYTLASSRGDRTDFVYANF